MVQRQYEKRTETEDEEDLNGEKDVAYILQAIEDRIPGKAPIYYIPGNHDSKSMFLKADLRPTLTINSVNLNNSWVELRPDLALVALGGSVPSYL